MKNLTYQTYLISCLLLFGFGHSFGQVDPALEADLQAILDDNLTAFGLKGVEATIILPDGCHWTGVSGVSDPNSTPVDTIRKWHWGSVGKAMTAAIVLQLDDEGELDVNDPIGDYLGVDTIPFLDGETTIKMLLNHTTDLNNSWENGSELWNAVWADRDSVWNIWSVLEPEYRAAGEPNPDLIHTYNGYDNYLMLGFLIEEVTGQTLDELYTSRLFEPLGFTNSVMGTQGIDMTDFNGLYDGDSYRGDLEHNSYMSTRGGGGAHLGSSHDVARFIRAFHNDELVSSGLMTEARQSTAGDPTVVPGTCLGTLSQTYGYGTNIVEYTDGSETVRFYGHGGNGLGNSLAFHNIDENFTLAITTNDFSSSAQQGNLGLFMTLVCHIWDNWPQATCVLSTIDAASDDFLIYPNPANTVLNIRTSTTPERISIYNMEGKRCLTATGGSSLNIEELDAGVYVVKVETDRDVVTKRWVKE